VACPPQQLLQLPCVLSVILFMPQNGMTYELEPPILGLKFLNPNDHSTKSHLRFLVTVLSAYRQMRNQERPILADIEEDNFDRAFDIFRPGGIISNVIVNQNSDLSMLAPNSHSRRCRCQELFGKISPPDDRFLFTSIQPRESRRLAQGRRVQYVGA